MESYIPWIVYTNIFKMIGYRHGKANEAQLDMAKLKSAMNDRQYIVIKATIEARPDYGVAGGPLWIFLIAPKSEYSTKTANFNKLVKTIRYDGQAPDLMFVSENPFNSHLQKAAAKIKDHFYEIYTYDKFLCEIPRHVLVPKHEIASLAETANHFQEYGGKPGNLQLIKPDDPAAVWCGLRLGQICKITRISELAGTAIVYRYCG